MSEDYSDPYGRPVTGPGFGRGGTATTSTSRVRRPVYLNTTVPPSQRNAVFAQAPLPSAQAFEAALKQRPGALNGTIGGGDLGRDVRWGLEEELKFREVVPLPDVSDVPSGGVGGGPSRQDLIDAAFGNLPDYAGYMPEADMQALADYYAGQRSALENVYAAQRGRIGDVSAQTLAALSAIEPQAAFVYDVGGPTIPDVNVDYLRALGASADPVSAEAEFARNILGYQLAASQRAAEGMAASLERERQARLAASRLMEQEGYTRAEQARAAALADLAARQAREEAVIRERVRQADEERARRDQELAMLRLELDLAGVA